MSCCSILASISDLSTSLKMNSNEGDSEGPRSWADRHVSPISFIPRPVLACG